MDETRYPLSWPAGQKRTTQRIVAAFNHPVQVQGAPFRRLEKLSVWDSIQRLKKEMRALKVPDGSCIVSTNIPTRLDGVPRSDRGEPKDPGVAVYWISKDKKKLCMAIDRYNRVADNIAAVAATLEALRAVERHGGGAILDRAFAGFAQLPASIVTQRPWREVFNVGPDDHLNVDAVNTRFIALARKLHPDQCGGDHGPMQELNAARADALKEANG